MLYLFDAYNELTGIQFLYVNARVNANPGNVQK